MSIKMNGKLSVSVVIVILTIIMASLTLGQFDLGKASAPMKAISLVAASGASNPLAPPAKWTPSSLSSLQAEWRSLESPILPSARVGSALTLNPINKIALLFWGD